MAGIHALPAPINADGARRLGDDLIEKVMHGVDLGLRGLQMRSLGQSLDALTRALRIELDELDATLACAGIPPSHAPQVRGMLTAIERLDALATVFEPPDRQPELGAARSGA